MLELHVVFRVPVVFVRLIQFLPTAAAAAAAAAVLLLPAAAATHRCARPWALDQQSVPFDDFHPEATRAAALSMIDPRLMKTYELRFDEVSDQELPQLTAAYDALFVRIAKRFVDEEITVKFADNNRAIDAIPKNISGIRELIARDFQRLYDGKIHGALYRLKQKTIDASLQRIRDAQMASNTWA